MVSSRGPTDPTPHYRVLSRKLQANVQKACSILSEHLRVENGFVRIDRRYYSHGCLAREKNTVLEGNGHERHRSL